MNGLSCKEVHCLQKPQRLIFFTQESSLTDRFSVWLHRISVHFHRNPVRRTGCQNCMRISYLPGKSQPGNGWHQIGRQENRNNTHIYPIFLAWMGFCQLLIWIWWRPAWFGSCMSRSMIKSQLTFSYWNLDGKSPNSMIITKQSQKILGTISF